METVFKTRFFDYTWNHSPSGENARVAEPLMHNWAFVWFFRGRRCVGLDQEYSLVLEEEEFWGYWWMCCLPVSSWIGERIHWSFLLHDLLPTLLGTSRHDARVSKATNPGDGLSCTFRWRISTCVWPLNTWECTKCQEINFSMKINGKI